MSWTKLTGKKQENKNKIRIKKFRIIKKSLFKREIVEGVTKMEKESRR